MDHHIGFGIQTIITSHDGLIYYQGGILYYEHMFKMLRNTRVKVSAFKYIICLQSPKTNLSQHDLALRKNTFILESRVSKYFAIIVDATPDSSHAEQTTFLSWDLNLKDDRYEVQERSEGCSLHAVALLDSIWIDKWHQLSLPTGKWAQLPFFGPDSHWNPQSGWHYLY